MWRLSTRSTTMIPKNSGASAHGRCVTAVTARLSTSSIRRYSCFNNTSAATTALRAATSATTATTTSNDNNNNNCYYNQQKQQQHIMHRRARLFHTTTSRYNAADSKKIRAEIASSWDLDDMDMANNNPDNANPDDIPDLLEHNQFRCLEEIADEDEEERERYRLNQEKVNAELDSRTGRPWRDPWHISDEQWMASDTSQESLPDWSPAHVSRVSLERLQILPAGPDGIPTLQTLADMSSLPKSDAILHPSREAKTYAAYRKSQHYKAVAECVAELAKGRVTKLLQDAAAAAAKTMTATSPSTPTSTSKSNNEQQENWSDRQDAVDALFEELQVDATNDASMDILSKHPDFHRWVERALEEYLRTAQLELQQKKEEEDSKKKKETESTSSSESESGDDKKEMVAASGEDKKEEVEAAAPLKTDVPIFMDCYDPTEAAADGSNAMVPKILSPLGPHRHGGPGRMVEEWELSAHTTTKRIMLRDCTRQIAQVLTASSVVNNESKVAAAAALSSSSPKIYVHGRKGAGKSAVLASIVASSRKSGYIVMYLPDGDRLRKNGFFITPSTHPNREGMFDLQDLSQEILQQLSDQHADQMKDMVADRATLETYFKETQLKRVDEYRAATLGDDSNDDGSMALTDLMNYAEEHKKHAPMCYSVVVNRLMHQQTNTDETTTTATATKFMIVMDEFNCLFDHGHYFHMAYDENVREAIPYNKINLFEPIMAAMNLSTKSAEEEEDDEEEDVIVVVDKEDTSSSQAAPNATVIVGTTESHSIRREITDALTDSAGRRSTSSNVVTTIEVPRFSSLEVDHILANFEATGVGKLRLDRGDTLMNPQEVEYLKMASGSIGQKLVDVSIF